MASENREVKWTCDLCGATAIVAKHYCRPVSWTRFDFDIKDHIDQIWSNRNRVGFDVCDACFDQTKFVMPEVVRKTLLQKTIGWIKQETGK